MGISRPRELLGSAPPSGLAATPSCRGSQSFSIACFEFRAGRITGLTRRCGSASGPDPRRRCGGWCRVRIARKRGGGGSPPFQGGGSGGNVPRPRRSFYGLASFSTIGSAPSGAVWNAARRSRAIIWEPITSTAINLAAGASARERRGAEGPARRTASARRCAASGPRQDRVRLAQRVGDARFPV